MGVGLIGPTAAHAEVHFNGFGQVVVGSTLDNSRPMPANTTLGEYSADPNFRTESLFALQAQASLSDTLSATAQILADGSTNGNPSPGVFTNTQFTPKFSWAYATWTINDNWSIKGGRQRIPLYHYSDYLQVGEAYPWLRTPISVYSSPVSDYDGVSLSGNFSVGDWFLQPQVYYGNFNGGIYYRQLNAQLSMSNLVGVVFDASYSDWLEIRASAHTSKATATYEEVTQLQTGLNELAGATGANNQLIAGMAAANAQFELGGVPADQLPFNAAIQDLTNANAQYQGYLNATNAVKQTLSFYSAGISINKYNFIFDSEYIFQHSWAYIPDTIAYYLSLGYKYKQFTPYILYGRDRKRIADKGEGNRMALDITGATNNENKGLADYATGCAFANSLSGGATCAATSPSDISSLATPQLLSAELNGADGVSGPVPQLLGGGSYLVNSANTIDDYYEVGLRYDVSRSTALKLDYTYYGSPQAQSSPLGSSPAQGYQHGQLLSAAFVFTF
jgi:hypothetical protein